MNALVMYYAAGGGPDVGTAEVGDHRGVTGLWIAVAGFGGELRL